MKRLFSLALLVCAPLLQATDFTTGQAARAVIGQSSFSRADPTASNQVVGGVSGLAYSNGLLFVADGTRLGSSAAGSPLNLPPVNNRVLMFYTSQIPDPRAALSVPSGVTPYTNCNLCGYPALNVLGQINFNSTTSGRAQQGSSTAGSMNNPTGVATDGQIVAVADTDNNRVLIWKSIPASLNAPADIVLGQPDFTTLQPAATLNSSSLSGPQSVWIQNGKLFVADTQDYRVLIWNSIPTSNNQPADLVLGQPNFTTKNAPPVTRTNPTAAANQLLNPVSVTSDGVHLFVADLGFNRVLIWNTIPTQMDQSADVVIGQPDMANSAPNNAPALCASNGKDSSGNPLYPARCAATLNFPRYALSDGFRLFVADGGNDRVLIYDQIPTANGASADIVLGQPDFYNDQITNPTASILSTNVDNTGSVDTTPVPQALAYDGTNLYVSDAYDRRVLVFTPGDVLMLPRSVLNAGSEITRQQGFVNLTGSAVANDSVTITIAGTDYKYTIKSGDNLATVTTGLINVINSSNSGAGDPNAIALTGAIANTVFLDSKSTTNAFDAVSLAATASNTANIQVNASGGYLTGGNAGTAAAGALIEINYTPPANGRGLSDTAVSADPNSAIPANESNPLPTALGSGTVCAGCSTQVYIDGYAAPIFRVSSTQVIAQVPFEYQDRSSSSVYVRTVHSDGTVTVTSALPVILAPANPGLFSAAGTIPRPALQPMHQAGNPSAVISIDGTVQAGDVPKITINSRSYTYTVLASDSLESIVNGLVTAINNGKDPQVVASAGGAFNRVVLTARQAGGAGSGIPISGTVTAASGQSSAGITVTAYTSATCCITSGTGPVTTANPAQPNETITLYATGLGALQDPNGNALAPATASPYNGPQPNSPTNTVSATVNGSTGQVVTAGLAAGGVGVYAVQVILPSSLTANAQTPVYIAQNAFVSNTVTIPVGASAISGSVISASPNPIPVAAGQTLGTTTISWNSTSTSVQVRIGSPSGGLFAIGSGTGSAQTGNWVTDGMVFYLQDATSSNPTAASSTLGTVTIHLTLSTSGGGGSGGGGTGSASPGVTFNATPNPIQVPIGTPFGETTINWNVPSSLASGIEVHVGSPSGVLFAREGDYGSATTGLWVAEGTTFYLMNPANGTTLGTVIVHVQQVSQVSGGQQSGDITLNPNPIITSGTLGRTTVFWNCGTCSAVQVRLGAPGGALFAEGAGSGSAATGLWVEEGTVFYLQDVSNGGDKTVGTVTAHLQAGSPQPSTQLGSIEALPNPATYLPGSAPLGQTTLTWYCPNCAVTEVHVGSPGGRLFAVGGNTGTATTGLWVTNGMIFYLQDASKGNGTSPANTISTVVVTVEQGQAPPNSTQNGGIISASPDPIFVAAGQLGTTTLTWSCSKCSFTEVHLGSPAGPLFAMGTGAGTATTGDWVTDGMVFYLQDATNGNATSASNTVATITVNLVTQ